MEDQNIVKAQRDITYFFNILNIDKESYSFGIYKENCICIFDDIGGYRIVQTNSNTLEDEKIVSSMFALIYEVLIRIERLEQKVKRL